MLRYVLPVALLIGATGLAGCDTTATQPDRQVVVEAYLEGGAPLPKVRVTRSVGIDQAFVPARTAVEDAAVEIRRLDDDRSVAQTIAYAETDPGIYRPVPSPTPEVQPLTTYKLVVEPDEGSSVTATTTVPDTISIVETENRVARYQGDAQPRFTITPPQSAREGQAVLALTTTSLRDFSRPDSALRDQLTPFYEDDYNPVNDSIETFRTTSSGVLNEANFTRTKNGRIMTRLPWISVAFYGPNSADVHVLDDNLYDLIRSQQVQSSSGPGAGLGPGEIPNVIEHVRGGTGVFASYVRDSAEVMIQRPAESQ